MRGIIAIACFTYVGSAWASTGKEPPDSLYLAMFVCFLVAMLQDIIWFLKLGGTK